MPKWDARKADRRLSETLTEIDEQYVAGALEWTRKHRPSTSAENTALVARVERAYHGEDMEGLESALSRYKRHTIDLVGEFARAVARRVGGDSPRAPLAAAAGQ